MGEDKAVELLTTITNYIAQAGIELLDIAAMGILLYGSGKSIWMMIRHKPGVTLYLTRFMNIALIVMLCAEIIRLVLIREPLEMIFDSLRSLVLFSPEEEIKRKVTEACEGILNREGCSLTYLDLIKTGRKIWAELYFLPSGNTIDLKRMQEVHREIRESAQKEFDSIYIELIPDIEEYHTLKPEEIRARRNELIRYLEEQEKKRQISPGLSARRGK